MKTEGSYYFLCSRLLTISIAVLTLVSCTDEKPTVMDQFPYEKISPSSWRTLKSIRDSYHSIANLDSVYEDRRHPNGLPYHTYVPAALSPRKAYPLVIFLHGQSDLGLHVHKGFPKGIWSLSAIQTDHPHVLFVPRHRTGDDDWTHDEYRTMVVEALDDLTREFNGDQSSPNIDPRRIYLTGFSQGGMGTWDYIKHYPDKFAAASPLSGFFHGPRDESEARAIRHIPIWIFNASNDDGVNGSRSSYQLLKKVGAVDVRYHEYVDHGHVIDDFAYFTEGFMDWLFSQERKD